MATFSTPTGTHDILPEEWPYWDFVLHHAREVAHLFSYRRIATPTFAPTSLFDRTSGAGSDIVNKEMYTFVDRDGESMTLRPEGTAPTVRAYLQHGMHKLPQPVKLYYLLDPMFRHDQPQEGRYREHHQFGCEAIGSADAYVDVEMIALLSTFLARLGLRDVQLHLNSIGDRECRPAYLESLVRYLREHEGQLHEIDRGRLQRNPLRVLDTKEHMSRGVVAGAPHMLDHLCEGCRAHWDRLLHGLHILDIPYVIDHSLVRGLDYYTRTVFEFIPDRPGQQSTVAAGGRYDALSEAMGGPEMPGIGFGLGLERLILNLKEQNVHVPPAAHPWVYVAHLGAETDDAALRLAHELRRADVAADMAFGSRSLRAQMRHANTLRASYAAIVGEDELVRGEVVLRDLETGEQRPVELSEVPSALSDEAETG